MTEILVGGSIKSHQINAREGEVFMSNTARIIGIDPGLRKTGWGIIETDGIKLSFVAAGTVKSGSDLSLASRLLQIFDGLELIITKYQPSEASIEQTFVNRDGKATLKLGQARGVAMLVPAKAGLKIAEYAPNQVKKSVIGVGHGDKSQMKAMLGYLLPRAKFDSDDAADALGIAVCHAHHRKMSNLLAAQIGGQSINEPPGVTS